MTRHITISFVTLLAIVIVGCTPAPVVEPTPRPTRTPTPQVATPAPQVRPGDNDGPDVERPAGLADDVELVGILPAEVPTPPVFSPDGGRIAYAVIGGSDDGFVGVEARNLPGLELQGRWEVENPLSVTWTPDGESLLFVYDRGDQSSIGLARLGEDVWEDLLPGEKADLNVNRTKVFDRWIDKETVIFWIGCGTGCGALYSLSLDGELTPLVNVPGAEDAVYGDMFSTGYSFSPDWAWLAATNWGRGLPETVLLPWLSSGNRVELAGLVDGRYTEAHSWAGHVLAFVAYPEGEPDTWDAASRADLYVWDPSEDGVRQVMPGVMWARYSPAGDRLAVVTAGSPRREGDEWVVDGWLPHLALLEWPSGRLLAAEPISREPVGDVLEPLYLLTPSWLPDGDRLAYRRQDGGIALMARNGGMHPVLYEEDADAVVWGAEGYAALLMGRTVWIIGDIRSASQGAVVTNLATPEATDGWAVHTMETFGVVLAYPADWQAVAGYEDRYGSADGFIQFSALNGEDWSVQQACEADAGHRLQPYGAAPVIESMTVDGREACLILPSEDQPEEMDEQAGLVVAYPQAMEIDGERYHFLIVWASQAHIRRMADSIQFVGVATP
jgi:hypothetical protein